MAPRSVSAQTESSRTLSALPESTREVSLTPERDPLMSQALPYRAIPEQGNSRRLDPSAGRFRNPLARNEKVVKPHGEVVPDLAPRGLGDTRPGMKKKKSEMAAHGSISTPVATRAGLPTHDRDVPGPVSRGKSEKSIFIQRYELDWKVAEARLTLCTLDIEISEMLVQRKSEVRDGFWERDSELIGLSRSRRAQSERIGGLARRLLLLGGPPT